MKEPGIVGGFLEAIWGPGLGYTGGSYGNYALANCRRCDVHLTAIEWNRPYSHCDAKLWKKWEKSNETKERIDKIKLSYGGKYEWEDVK